LLKIALVVKSEVLEEIEIVEIRKLANMTNQSPGDHVLMERRSEMLR